MLGSATWRYEQCSIQRVCWYVFVGPDLEFCLLAEEAIARLHERRVPKRNFVGPCAGPANGDI
jgi:hypothetical protein